MDMNKRIELWIAELNDCNDYLKAKDNDSVKLFKVHSTVKKVIDLMEETKNHLSTFDKQKEINVSFKKDCPDCNNTGLREHPEFDNFECPTCKDNPS